MQNELVNTQTGEITNERISADGKYVISQDVNGKFSRRQLYKEFSSVVATTHEQKIALFNLLNEEGQATPMKDAIGTQISLRDVIIQPYDKVNEETGEMEYGVVTYLIGQDDKAYVTSSKTVYNSLQNLTNAFGQPSYASDFAPIIEIIEQPSPAKKSRTIVNIRLIG